ncbi:phosphomannomutase/phosphoglucomutase [Methylonatrum kenyense]|uniref:phosphomannomutase/phosphoglucomutase n=1 Tax=Methylonatrum kenyense TaxID=455253 RepID=UPI0020BD78FA|nr:phosphomannomutase/phosphoglucomutase [Methylonatrum kenyense]MCK8515503.1 phosphomannomutase/phosphoglucomutase [Methylonatrum kenyense]
MLLPLAVWYGEERTAARLQDQALEIRMLQMQAQATAVADAVAWSERWLEQRAEDPVVQRRTVNRRLPAELADELNTLWLLPLGIDEPMPRAVPPIGFALHDMLQRSEEGAERVPPEAHRLADGEVVVYFLRTVSFAGEPRAHLVLRQPIAWLERQLDRAPAGGPDVALFQQTEDGRVVRLLGEVGESPDSAERVPVGGTPWLLQASEPLAPEARPALSSPLFLFATLLAVLAILHLLAAAPGRAAATPAAARRPGSPSVEKGTREIAMTQEPDTETMVRPSPEIRRDLFRAYDIRGRVDAGLNEAVVQEIGRAIGSEAVDRDLDTLVVARDGRESSPALAEALGEGLRSAGIHVIDIGQVPTPVMYFATYHLQTGSGVVVTGSHNPPDYNGLKIMLGGETLSGDAIAGLYDRLQDGRLVRAPVAGDLRLLDVVPDYLQRILADVRLTRPLRVVVDCGNGVAGSIAPRLLRELGCEVHELFCEVDGSFPNHHPDPADPANLQTLIEKVAEVDAHVGLAFDGDGDRLGVVDGGGKIIWPDRQLMLYAREILAVKPGADIIFDVKCSAHLARIIEKHAGVPVMWRTGHSIIKAKLKQSGAPLAGEMSGHIFFNDRWDGFDDGMYTAARLLEILAHDPRPSTEVFAELPETVSTPELKVQLEEGEPPRVIERLMRRARFPDARVTTIDGLRVDFSDGWGLVRSSNTTPCLVLRFEADNEAALERIKTAFRELLAEASPGTEPGF